MALPVLGRRPGLDISVPVFVEGSPVKWGTVRVGLSMDSIYDELYRTRLAILALGIVVLILAFFVAIFSELPGWGRNYA